MPRPRSAKEVSCECKSTAELLGFHLCESCLKLNEDCLKKFAKENAKEQLKVITEDVAELKMVIKTRTSWSMPLKTKEDKLKNSNRTSRS